jgi:hypothetical protein
MVLHRHIAAVVAIAVGLTPSLAPIASADPTPRPHAQATTTRTQNNTPVRPTSLGPGDSPTAIGYSGPVSQPSSPPGDSPTAIGYSEPVSQPSPAPQTVVRVVASHDGFDWGDAGIGAGAVLVLLGIGLATPLLATNGRRGRARKQRAVVTS